LCQPRTAVTVLEADDEAPARGLRLGTAITAEGGRSPVRIAPGLLTRHVHVVGATGTGKSTLLRLLGGVEEPDSGEVIPGHGRMTTVGHEKRHNPFLQD